MKIIVVNPDTSPRGVDIPDISYLYRNSGFFLCCIEIAHFAGLESPKLIGIHNQNFRLSCLLIFGLLCGLNTTVFLVHLFQPSPPRVVDE
uniref:Uncharacterized protein n=1 Tax=Parascaris equorum TaxID=6256 RepID=A0A914R1C4_PAREQ